MPVGKEAAWGDELFFFYNLYNLSPDARGGSMSSIDNNAYMPMEIQGELDCDGF